MAAAVHNHALALLRSQSHELDLNNDAVQAPDQALDASYSTNGAFWQHQWDADEADAADAWPTYLDADDAEEEGIPVVDSEAAPEDDHPLSTKYAAMLFDRNETTLFDLCSSIPTHKYEAELCRVLGGAFSRCLADQDEHGLLDSQQIIQHIASSSNYAVETVVRVMNKPHYRMQQAFAENYRLDAMRTVYHGTSEEGATFISAVGFKAAAGRRAKFGKGIYSSPIVWEALGYAKPYRDARQMLFVVELLQGPTAQGSEEQVDFGVDVAGSEVLTLTNPTETILCAAKENQMLATHRITMLYKCEVPFVNRHRECIRVVHADIALIISHAKANAVAQDTPAASNPASLRFVRQIKPRTHKKFSN